MEVNFKEELENSLLLYLPTNISLSDTGRLEYEFEQVTSANYQVDLLVNGESDTDYFLDFLESQDVNMDDYLAIACDNLERHLQI